jgi:hypothetical protein
MIDGMIERIEEELGASPSLRQAVLRADNPYCRRKTNMCDDCS